MRNTNTSLFENAICRFGNEAGQVLRAITDPATSMVRLISTAVGTLLSYLESSYRLQRLIESMNRAIVESLAEHADRCRPLGKTFGNFGQRGFDGWSGLAVQTVS